MKRLLDLLTPLTPLFLISLGMETAVKLGWIPEYLIPAPSQVLVSFSEDKKDLVMAFLSTSSSALLGLGLSLLIGFIVAVCLSLSKFLLRMILPYAVLFQTVPVVAIAPLLVIWFGFGMPTVVASSFVVSVFPILTSSLLGLKSTDPGMVALFQLYGASGWFTLLKLRIPFALPEIFNGIRIATGLAVIGAIVGEFIGGGGLGSVIDAARTQQRVDRVFAAVILATLLGVLMVSIVNLLAARFLKTWHVSAK